MDRPAPVLLPLDLWPCRDIHFQNKRVPLPKSSAIWLRTNVSLGRLKPESLLCMDLGELASYWDEHITSFTGFPETFVCGRTYTQALSTENFKHC